MGKFLLELISDVEHPSNGAVAPGDQNITLTFRHQLRHFFYLMDIHCMILSQ